MTTADRHADADPRHGGGGAYRASEVDVTAQDDAARYESVDDSTTGTARHPDDSADDRADDRADDSTAREPGGYAQRHDADATEDTVDGRTTTQRLDSQDSDLRAASDPTPTDATATDEPRTEGGHPHSAGSVDGSDVRTVDVGGSGPSGDTAATSTGSAGSDKLERLVPSDRVQEYTSRWDAVKGEFVDEPRQAVAKADKLVGELLDELDQLFRKQRSDLEHGLDADETSTEDLRLALRRYRSFFDRLLEL